MFIVTCRDRAGATLAPSRVRMLGEAGARELTPGDGERWSLAASELAPGRQQLRVELPGRPELCFSLEAKPAKHGVALEFVRPEPRCCELRRDGDATVLELTVAASHHELVFVSGWDYSGGSEHRRWSETWRDDLRDGQTMLTGEPRELPRLIDEHTVVTLFDFATGERIQQLAAPKGWHESDRTLQGTVATHLGSLLDDEANQKRHDDDSISIVHVYRHIIELGRRSPGSLAALHVFSHAWAGGPILVNTDQHERYAYSSQRDPGDKDGRTKDFSPANMPELEHFAAAFAPDAIAKIWGCYATTLYRRMVRAAAKAHDLDKQLTVRADQYVRKVSAREIEAEFRQTIIGDSYMARLGRAAGITVYGAPPGMGSNLKRIAKRYYMFVEPRVYDLEYHWYAEVLGLEPDISGHVPYSRSQLVA
jgi:hypothetical protein